ncbi:glycosyltransferase [Deinococcus sonorensis]|uniref:Glycosyltransferase n=2 Tax=Deinococcus sonorensis TaxID=309891 RepID=A0AAU7UC21_9DEIO
MRLSVVIPARDEEGQLPALLRALAAQQRPPDEVIVVDNASRDATARVARSLGATVLPCVRPGVAYARQCGLEAAIGDWVVSTDADSVPPPDWLLLLEAAMQPGTVCVYGPLRLQPWPRRVGPLGSALSEWGYRLFLYVMSGVGRPNTAGANMAVQREAALRVGGYPAVEAREDVLLGLALQRLGRVQYVPGALVQTSARRLQRGWLPFLWQQLRNLAGRTSGYFEPHAPRAPGSGQPEE